VELNDGMGWLDRLAPEQLQARIGEAELRIEEEASVLDGCKRRLERITGGPR